MKPADSLDRDETGAGEISRRSQVSKSLGQESTLGDTGSSVSDIQIGEEEAGDAMEVVSLSPRYVVKGVIGRGGMGEVLRAEDTRLKRHVAIKRMLGEKVGSGQALRRFLTEAQSIGGAHQMGRCQQAVEEAPARFLPGSLQPEVGGVHGAVNFRPSDSRPSQMMLHNPCGS